MSKTASKVQPKPLSYYLSLNYPITVYPDSEGGFVAEIKELPECLTQGETVEEVMETSTKPANSGLRRFTKVVSATSRCLQPSKTIVVSLC